MLRCLDEYSEVYSERLAVGLDVQSSFMKKYLKICGSVSLVEWTEIILVF